MITFLINRSKRHWQVLATVFLGVLISTVFLASGPIIVDTVINFALPHKLRATFEENGIIFLSTYNNLGQIDQLDLNSDLQNLIPSSIDEVEKVVFSSASSWLFPWQEGSLITDERINFRFFAGIEEKIEFSSGDWPEASTPEENIFAAIVPQIMAEAYIIEVGDLLPMSKKLDETQPSLWIEVAGIYHPQDAGDPYWLIEDNPFQTQNNSRYFAEYGVLVNQEDYYIIAEAIFPGSNHNLKWLGIIDPGQVNSNKIGEIVEGIEDIRTGITSFERKIVMETNLESFLETYQYQSSEIIPPIYLLIGEVLFLGLYYVVMVAALSIRQVEGELSILASRGAEFNQLLRIQLFDALLICAVAFFSGPLLANLIISSLASIGPLGDINQVDWITRIPTTSWIAAGVSVFACFTALIIPTIPIIRRSVVQHHQTLARRISAPWWHRYYLDVFLLIIGLIALWRLSLYGSISGLGQGNVDLLLLFAPLALLIGSATVLLRVFPAIFRLFATLVAKGRGLTAAVALWHTSRDPTHVTRLILLFTLAMALGVLSTGLNATLTYSEYERARHATGGEARLSFINFVPLSSLKTIQQVTNTSAVWRGDGRANVRSYRSIPNFSILAIEPISFAAVSQFRKDYSDDYIGFVLGQLIVDPEQLPVTVIPLPRKPTNIGIWIVDPFPARTNVDLLDYVDIRVKLQTSEEEITFLNLDLNPNPFAIVDDNSPIYGSESTSINWFQYFSLIFREAENLLVGEQELASQEPTWRYFEGEIPVYAEEGYPLSLHSIWIKIRPLPDDSGGSTNSQGPLIIDDLSIRDSDQELVSFEGFEEISTIWQTNDTQSVISYSKSDITQSGEASMRLYFGLPGTSNWMVLSPAQTTRLNFIPILASPKFLETTGLEVGDKFSAFIGGLSLILEIKNSVNYFPSMYDTEEKGFVILSRDALLAELNRVSRVPVNYNEIWMRVDENQEAANFQGTIPQVKHQWMVEAERILFKSDPLTLGLRSVIFLGYSLTLLLSLVGFATYMFLSARQRASVYGILRSLGLSTFQLYASLVLEQLILILSGLGLGIGLGILINKMVLPGLPISFADVPPIPPFIPQEDWNSVIRLVLIMLGGFLFTLAIGTILLWRLKLHQVLRVGEE